jgi:cytoplasmic iron level regulating protein YaaA (DUF328/UPF0246 family)
MKIILSPAKSLNFDRDLPTSNFSKCIFLKESKIINASLKLKTPAELTDLMDISQKLADLNWQRNQSWKLPFTTDNARPAIFTFDGDVYGGLDVFSLQTEKLDTLQNKVRILSGLYGILKPLDLIQAYRLEMGTKIAIDNSKNLYEFWKHKITTALNKELKANELFINLASNEYFEAVDKKALKTPIITPEFKDYHNGKLKIISFFAKRARGRMARYILDHEIETLDGIKNFDYDGYKYDALLSKENNLVFTR